MFDVAFDSLRKATDATLQMQQEVFKKFAGFWPNVAPSPAAWGEQVQKFPRKWAETVAEIVKKQNEMMETQFKAGLRNIEEAFRLAKVKDPEELRAKTIELWEKTFECLRQAFEAQTREFQAAVSRWNELVTRGGG
jgi:hypothetical protein